MSFSFRSCLARNCTLKSLTQSGLWLHSRSPTAANQPLSWDGCLGAITSQIAGNDVLIDVDLQTIWEVAKQAFLDKLLGKLAQGFDKVNVQIEIIGLGASGKIIATFANG